MKIWKTETKTRGFGRDKFAKHFALPKMERVLALDIECVKVAAPKGWPQKTRFQTIMIGIGYYEGEGKVLKRVIEVVEGSESDLIRWLDDVLDGGFDCVVFSGTRDFDRNVLTGLWVNARRALAPKPGPWPTLREEQEDVEWINLHELTAPQPDRSADPFWGKSKDILAWPNLDQDGVREHNRLDVLELMMRLERNFK